MARQPRKRPATPRAVRLFEEDWAIVYKALLDSSSPGKPHIEEHERQRLEEFRYKFRPDDYGTEK